MKIRIRRRFLPSAVENVDFVVCKECGMKFRAITFNHLKPRHSMTVADYQQKYPDAILYAEVTRDSLRTFLGKNHTKEYRAECSKRMSGKNNPMYGLVGDKNFARRPEVRAKISRAVSGEKNGYYGKKHTKEWKRRQSEFLKASPPMRNPEIAKKLTGSGNGRWLGGISFEPYGVEFSGKLKEFVRERDGRVCQLCGVPECECYRKLDVHHLDYDKQNNSSRNLISLCQKCHIETNFNREFYTVLFKKKMEKHLSLPKLGVS